MKLEDLKANRLLLSISGGIVCAKCGEKNADDARTCKDCGQSLYVKCLVCGEENLRSRSACSVTV